MKTKQLHQRMEALTKQIAKDRDALDDLISDATDLRESCAEALDALDSARDYLSQLV